MWFVYILICSNGEYYNGCTSSLEERLSLHQKIQFQSTNDLLSIQLISYTAFMDKHRAYELEKYQKSVAPVVLS